MSEWNQENKNEIERELWLWWENWQLQLWNGFCLVFFFFGLFYERASAHIAHYCCRIAFYVCSTVCKQPTHRIFVWHTVQLLPSVLCLCLAVAETPTNRVSWVSLRNFICVRAFSYYHSLLTLANALKSVWLIRTTSQIYTQTHKSTNTHKDRQSLSRSFPIFHSVSVTLVCCYEKYTAVIELNNYSLLLCCVNCLFINMVFVQFNFNIDIDKTVGHHVFLDGLTVNSF